MSIELCFGRLGISSIISGKFYSSMTTIYCNDIIIQNSLKHYYNLNLIYLYVGTN